MKTIKMSLVLVSVGLMFGALVGCSSGSSDSEDTSLTAITPAVAESLALSASEAINGCTYSSATVLSASTYMDVITKSPVREAIVNTTDAYVPYLATTVNETYVGTCPINPGSYTIVGTHDDGVDNLTYTFIDYCLGDENASITENGTLSVVNVATPTDAGPIPIYSTVSTGSGGIVTDEVNADGNFTNIATLSNLKYTYGNPVANDTGVPTVDHPNVLTIGAISGTDGETNNTFSASNVSVSTYVTGTSSVTTITSLTYTDSKNGTVNVSSTPITVDENGLVTNDPTITVTGADGTSLIMSSSATVDNGFDVIVGGTTLGVMDCSDLAVAF